MYICLFYSKKRVRPLKNCIPICSKPKISLQDMLDLPFSISMLVYIYCLGSKEEKKKKINIAKEEPIIHYQDIQNRFPFKGVGRVKNHFPLNINVWH